MEKYIDSITVDVIGIISEVFLLSIKMLIIGTILIKIINSIL